MTQHLAADPAFYKIVNGTFVTHAAGTQAHLTSPYPRAIVNSLRTILTCDANVANRYLMVSFWLNGVAPFLFIDPIPITAGQTADISIAPFIPYSHVALAVPTISIPLPPDLELNIADYLILDCLNLQVGDDFTPSYFQLKVWEAL